MRPRVLRAFLVALLFSPTFSSACGPFFPVAYLAYGEEANILQMPRPYFSNELALALGQPWPERPNKTQLPQSLWQSTLEADVADLNAALTKRGDPAERVEELSRQYRDLRTAMDKQCRMPSVIPPPPDPYAAIRKETAATPPPEFESPPSFDFAPLDSLLSELPVEFALYVRGAHAYRNKDSQNAVSQWKSLLNLPAEERHYRSTWAAYMLAKALHDSDPERSLAYFKQVGELVQAGISDSLNLAPDSQNWIARREMESGDFPAAMKRYVDVYLNAPNADKHVALLSIGELCDKALSAPNGPESMAADPACRRIVTACVASKGFRYMSRKLQDTWMGAVDALDLEAPIDGADRLAWAAYRNGDMEAARHWVELANASAPYALWVQSKLDLRDGEIDKGMETLRQAANAFPPEQSWLWGEDYVPRITPYGVANAELGVLLLGRSDYVNAFDCLIRSDYWLDAAYVAERVLTIEELQKYIVEHGDDPDLSHPVDRFALWYVKEKPRGEMLRELLARRLIREERWDEAISLLPEETAAQVNELRRLLAEAGPLGKPVSIQGWGGGMEQYIAKLRSSGRKRVVDETRAQILCDAAELVRENGMEFMGTEVEPDWHVFIGKLEQSGASANRLVKPITSESPLNPALTALLNASDGEKQRAKAHAPEMERRFHYRYLAAYLMWRSADYLPDNDLRTMRALYQGGMYIQNRDPEAADKFYKALVWRNPKMPYAQEADKKRWFPSTPPE
ncbi:MAG: hypothetical protein IT364_23125 [Candidatus Hydrogenedentes bacterium]|nr:hypothetical protein [Candidatus Hydrogenedentota bacterium]